MKDLLKTALMSQDFGQKGVDRILKAVEDDAYPHGDDPITDVTYWAIISEDEAEDDGHDDYLSRISTNFDYAINQLRRAQMVLDKYRKHEKCT